MLFSSQGELARKVRPEPYGLNFDQWAMDWIERIELAGPSLPLGNLGFDWDEAANQKDHISLSFVNSSILMEATVPNSPFSLYIFFMAVYTNDYIIWHYFKYVNFLCNCDIQTFILIIFKIRLSKGCSYFLGIIIRTHCCSLCRYSSACTWQPSCPSVGLCLFVTSCGCIQEPPSHLLL